jgi:hypothetical protein
MWFDYAAIGIETVGVRVLGVVWVLGTMYRPSMLALLLTSLQTLYVDFPACNGAIFALLIIGHTRNWTARQRWN